MAKIRAKGGEQEIPIHIFPNKMTNENYNSLNSQFASNALLLEFWSWLKPGFDAFEKSNIVPVIAIDDAGKYVIK